MLSALMASLKIDDATQRTDRIWRHTLGQPQDKDELLYQENDATFRAGASLAENRETVLLGSYANMAQEWYALDARDGERARAAMRRHFAVWTELTGTD